MIPFSSLPANIRVPLFYAELDNSRANSGPVPRRTLLVGQQLAAGTMAAGVAVLLAGVPWLKAAAGAGSQLAMMADWYRKRDSFGEVWVLPVGDAAGSAAAAGTIALGGTITAAGTLFVYVGGALVTVGAAAAQTPAALATALAAALNATPDLPVTASAASGTVTLTAKNKGLIGNDIDLRVNYRGDAGGESLPAGLTVTLTPMSGGTANPAGATLDAALSALGERSFDFVAWGWSDTATLDSLKNWLASQWDPMRMLYGGGFAAYRGTLSAANTLGALRNDPHTSILPAYDSPTPPWCWAANFCGASAVSLRNDPGIPLHSLPLDVMAPPPASRFKKPEMNTLLFSGMSAFTVDDDGTVRLSTIITTYQKNAQNTPDDSYLYIETLFILMASLRDLQAYVTSTFGRSKLADDGTNFRPGSAIATPNMIRNGLIGRYRRQERDGLVQQSDLFAQALLVQRNSANSCRVDGLVPIVPIDQLRQVALLIQFRKSTDVL